MQDKKEVKIPYFLTKEYAIKEKQVQRNVGIAVGAVALVGIVFLLVKGLFFNES